MGSRFSSGKGNRFNVKLPVTEDPNGKETEALHVKEIAEKDYETEVVATALPVVLDFHGGKESKACETLAPRFAAVAERYAGKVRFLKVKREANPRLAATLGVTVSPTLVFLQGGKEKGERLSGEDIQRTALKARVEAMLGTPAAK
ncbi:MULTISPECIES: co-chaperone YbbN [unclassified Anaeromyxobacter]|uniref:thioredoxin family protein n=1 Tax=unclassified Anaeromyxobacter TaxID=2620896 RepID=UPI001F573A56|nr:MULTISPECIES: thioredoxin family protein [unclassified Anaeromyxobacter]